MKSEEMRNIELENNIEEFLENTLYPINEKLYKSFFEYANDAIFIMYTDRFIDCNNKTVEMFGYKKEILTHKLSDFSPDFQPDGTSSNKKLQNYIEQTIKGNPQRFYWTHKKKNGDIFDCEVSLNSITKDSPKLIFAIVRNISFLKKMEQQLVKLSLAVEQSPASIVITNIDGDIEYVNPKFCEITGYSFNELIGKNPRVLKSGWTSDDEYKTLWDIITSGKMWKGIFRNKRKDGSYYWESALIAPIKDSGGKIINYIGVKEDITRQKELEEQLLQIQKLESIGTLAGGIAHEFNNVLTAINGYAQLILSKTEQNKILHDYAHSILTGGARAAELVKNLLAFSRKQIIQPRITNINDIIKNLKKILVNTIEEDIDLLLELSDNVLPVKADPSQIQQILINLVTNARDAVNQKKSTSESKRITIKTENKYIYDDKATKHPEIKKGQYICLIVEDNGIGMDKKTLKKIYDPFFTTKPKWMGSGLGLSTVYGIVKQNNGHIEVTTYPDKGTLFKIYWPVANSKDKNTDEFTRHETSNNLSVNKNIFLVEDNETLRKFISHSLSISGFNVTSFEDGLTALEKIKNENISTSIDLIISDIVMPKMGGIELVQNLKMKFPNTKVILITGYPLDKTDSLKHLDNNTYLLHKPFKFSELVNLINKIFL